MESNRESWAPNIGNELSPHAKLSNFYRAYLYGEDPVRRVADAFAKEADFRFRQAGIKKVIGHSELTKEPDGTIKAAITFYPDEVKEMQSQAIEDFEDEIINGRPRNDDDISKNGRFED